MWPQPWSAEPPQQSERLSDLRVEVKGIERDLHHLTDDRRLWTIEHMKRHTALDGQIERMAQRLMRVERWIQRLISLVLLVLSIVFNGTHDEKALQDLGKIIFKMLMPGG